MTVTDAYDASSSSGKGSSKAGSLALFLLQSCHLCPLTEGCLFKAILKVFQGACVGAIMYNVRSILLIAASQPV